MPTVCSAPGKAASGTQKKYVTRRNKRTDQLAVVQELGEELNRKIASAEKARESVVEWLLNNGIDASSGKASVFGAGRQGDCREGRKLQKQLPGGVEKEISEYTVIKLANIR